MFCVLIRSLSQDDRKCEKCLKIVSKCSVNRASDLLVELTTILHYEDNFSEKLAPKFCFSGKCVHGVS